MLRNLLRCAFVLITISVMAFLAISCGSLSNDDDVDSRFYGYFLRDAKVMQDKGLPVYWLGRQFTPTLGGLTFTGPHGVEFGGEIEGGGIFMGYSAWLAGTPGEGQNVGLEIRIYSPGAWELVKDRLLYPRLMSNEGKVTRQTVRVRGSRAELISIPSFTRRVDRVRLILELDPVVVVAEAASDGTQYSIFTRNPDLFVQVIDQNLRPYPQ